VLKKAPMNPSQVFLGDKSDKVFLPNNLPHMYAVISLQITREAGKINLNNIIKIIIYHTNPLKILLINRADWTPNINSIT